MPLSIPPFTPTPIGPTSAETFATYVRGQPAAKIPLSGTELFPILQNGFIVQAPATSLIGTITVGGSTIFSGTDTNILFDKAGVVGEDAGLEWHYTPQTMTVGAGAPLTDANGKITLSVKGPTNTDILALTDGTAQFGFFVSPGIYVLGTVTNTSFGFFQGNNNTTVGMNSARDFTLDSGLHIGWNAAGNPGGVFSPQDTSFARESAGVVQLFDFTSLTTPTGLHVYNTTDTAAGVPTNYERGVFDWTTTANVLTIGTQNGVSGTGRPLKITSAANSGGTLDFGVSVANAWQFVAQSGTATLAVQNPLSNSFSQIIAINDSNSFAHSATFGFSGTTAGQAVTHGPTVVQGFQGTVGSHPFVFYTGNTASFLIDTSQNINVIATSVLGWVGSAANLGAAVDTGLARAASNVVEINNGTTGTGPGVILPRPTTFANLPASPTQGMMASITDGLAANCADGTCTTFGTNVTGGTGALKLNLWYNGTHWTLIGK